MNASLIMAAAIGRYLRTLGAETKWEATDDRTSLVEIRQGGSVFVAIIRQDVDGSDDAD